MFVNLNPVFPNLKFKFCVSSFLFFNESLDLEQIIKRLEAEGILTGFHASVDPIQLGYHIKAYISLEISPAQKPEVYPFLRAHPNVLECDCVTGNYSVLLKVAFSSTMIVFSTIVENRGVVPE